MKKLLAVVVLCAAGWLVYAQLLASPEGRICDRMADLCQSRAGDTASCEEDLGKIRRSLGDDALERVEGCVDGSETCVEAAACMGAAVTEKALEQVIEGAARGFGE